jgi:predicted AAA+ superfamily ATPase
MRRDSYNILTQWKDGPSRKPILIQGARQVGKSWLVKEFANNFENFIELNLEKTPSYNKIFEGDLDGKTLIENISLFTQKKIIPGKTLVFIDEIQNYERAIIALRYFYEEIPELHVIAAGSLVQFAIDKVGVPVGRISFLYLYPLSFGEFLDATGHHKWREYLCSNAATSLLHDQLLDLVRLYSWLGGMPSVVQAWIDRGSPSECLTIQEQIIAAYKQDFLKYANSHLIEKVDKIFTNIPQQLGNKFKYTNVDPDLRSTTLKEALDLLCKASIAHICYHSSAQGFPLGGEVNFKRFKIFFFDIGLAQRILGTELSEWMKQPINVSVLGGIAEQFVAQELLAYQDPHKKPELFYWHRENKNSNAEVDFVITHQQQILPIEVKSGRGGRYQSMNSFLDSHEHSPYGIIISEKEQQINDRLHWLPLYKIEGFLKGGSGAS